MEVPVRLDHTMASSELKLDRTENRTASSAASCQKKIIHATFRYHEAKSRSAILARIRSLMPRHSRRRPSYLSRLSSRNRAEGRVPLSRFSRNSNGFLLWYE